MKQQTLGLMVAALVALPLAANAAPDTEDPELMASSILFLKGQEKIDAFRSQREIAQTRTVEAGVDVLALPDAPVDLSAVRIESPNGAMSVEDYLEFGRVAGFIVLKDGEVAYERYRFGNDADTRWMSFSVTKSVVSMLVGAAIADGYIDGVDDRITRYLPQLAGSSYEAVTVRNLLQMASGVQWNEDYADPTSDVAAAPYETSALYGYLGSKKRAARPGRRFNYNTAETNLAGTLVRNAIGNNLSTYLSAKIWQPFGMQSDADWNLTEPAGGEMGGCCINATLRDYARLGLFAAADGVLPNGTRVLPEGWMAESTAPSQGYEGYGYFWWLEGEGKYRAAGIFGQGIYIEPQTGIVIAMHSAREHADSELDSVVRAAAFEAIAAAVR